MILHDAIANANLRAVADTLAQRPEDINLLDESNHSVLFCALVGHSLSRPAPNSPERNAILKAILSRPELSIYALNAAMDCALGATPLTLACKMNRLEHVNILLDCPSVLVDTRDASGLTPLMHAVHGQYFEIVMALLRSGARANLLDPSQRSILQYSQNLQIRLLLENQLRVERNPRSAPSSHASSSDSSSGSGSYPSSHLKPTAHSRSSPDSIATATSEELTEDLFRCLISAINTNDLPLLHASLEVVVRQGSSFSSLVTRPSNSLPYSILNKLDEFGFAPIHHAMFCRPPNFAIVDALFLAGADVNLLTSTLKSPLQILVEYARPAFPEDNHTLHLLVRHLIQDLGASPRYRDNELETAMHLAAEHGSCRELLEALVEADSDAVVREWKNKRSLRPADIAKPEYRNVFGDRPDSMCTVRPIRTKKRSLASMSSFSSFTSMTSVASSATVTLHTAKMANEPLIIGMSLQEALKGSQILLDEIDLSLLQRTLFYRSSLDMEHPEAPKSIDESLSRTSVSVISYWNSCLSLIREEVDSIQKAVVKSHLLVARTKREVDQKTRDDEREVAQAILMWEEQQIVEERIAVKDQARGRAFTAPARIPESPSDSDSSQRFWMLPKKWSMSGSATPTEGGAPHSPSENNKRANRVTSFIKQKLRPSSRHRQETAAPRGTSRPQLPLLKIPSPDSCDNEPEAEEAYGETQLNHQMRHLSLSQSQSMPSTPTKAMYRRPSTATISTRGTIRKAPVVLTRLHTDLLRIEEYIRGIHTLAKDFEKETSNAASQIEHCLIRCAQAEENEYEDEMQLERLRSLLLVVLERKVDEMCQALEVVRKWNGLVRSLLREFRRKVKGGEDLNDTYYYDFRPQTAS